MKLVVLAALSLAWMAHDAVAAIDPPATLNVSITGTVASATSMTGNPGTNMNDGKPIVLPKVGTSVTFEVPLVYYGPGSPSGILGYGYDTLTGISGPEAWYPQSSADGPAIRREITTAGPPPGVYQFAFVAFSSHSFEPHIFSDTVFLFEADRPYPSDIELFRAIGDLTGTGYVTYGEADYLDFSAIADFDVRLIGLHAVVTPLPGGLALLLAPLTGLGVAYRRRHAAYRLRGSRPAGS